MPRPTQVSTPQAAPLLGADIPATVRPTQITPQRVDDPLGRVMSALSRGITAVQNTDRNREFREERKRRAARRAIEEQAAPLFDDLVVKQGEFDRAVQSGDAAQIRSSLNNLLTVSSSLKALEGLDADQRRRVIGIEQSALTGHASVTKLLQQNAEDAETAEFKTTVEAVENLTGAAIEDVTRSGLIAQLVEQGVPYPEAEEVLLGQIVDSLRDRGTEIGLEDDHLDAILDNFAQVGAGSDKISAALTRQMARLREAITDRQNTEQEDRARDARQQHADDVLRGRADFAEYAAKVFDGDQVAATRDLASRATLSLRQALADPSLSIGEKADEVAYIRRQMAGVPGVLGDPSVQREIETAREILAEDLVNAHASFLSLSDWRDGTAETSLLTSLHKLGVNTDNAFTVDDIVPTGEHAPVVKLFQDFARRRRPGPEEELPSKWEYEAFRNVTSDSVAATIFNGSLSKMLQSEPSRAGQLSVLRKFVDEQRDFLSQTPAGMRLIQDAAEGQIDTETLFDMGALDASILRVMPGTPAEFVNNALDPLTSGTLNEQSLAYIEGLAAEFGGPMSGEMTRKFQVSSAQRVVLAYLQMNPGDFAGANEWSDRVNQASLDLSTPESADLRKRADKTRETLQSRLGWGDTPMSPTAEAFMDQVALAASANEDLSRGQAAALVLASFGDLKLVPTRSFFTDGDTLNMVSDPRNLAPSTKREHTEAERAFNSLLMDSSLTSAQALVDIFGLPPAEFPGLHGPQETPGLRSGPLDAAHVMGKLAGDALAGDDVSEDTLQQAFRDGHARVSLAFDQQSIDQGGARVFVHLPDIGRTFQLKDIVDYTKFRQQRDAIIDRQNRRDLPRPAPRGLIR